MINRLRRFLIALMLMAFLGLLGISGYMYLEGMSFHEALYMTVITISTVGYAEVNAPLSLAGQHFTIVFIISSFIIAGFAVASITAFFIEGNLNELLKGRRMQRQIHNLTDHYIICGCGSLGREIALEFIKNNTTFIIIDKDLSEVDLPNNKILTVEGDATQERTLKEAGLTKAKGLIAALRHDTDNVFITLTARQLNPNLQIVARAGESGTSDKLLLAGANRVIAPFEIAGHRIAQTILRPTIVNFLDVVIQQEGFDLNLEEIHIGPHSKLVGSSIRQTILGQISNAVIIGLHDIHGQARVVPAENESIAGIQLNAGDVLIALGSEIQLQRLKDFAE